MIQFAVRLVNVCLQKNKCHLAENKYHKPTKSNQRQVNNLGRDPFSLKPVRIFLKFSAAARSQFYRCNP